MARVYVFGAGASVIGGAPVLKNFFAHVFNAYPDDERAARVARFITDLFGTGDGTSGVGREWPKYETVLSFIDLALRSKSAFDARYNQRELGRLRNDLVYLLWLSLRQAAARDEPDPVHFDFVSSRLEDGDSIVSLNYDLLLDTALCARFGSIDYGLEFEHVFDGRRDGTPLCDNSDGGIWTCGSPSRHEARRAGYVPRLFKLHGSLNWLVCPTCQAVNLYLGEEAVSRIFGTPAELCPEDGSYLEGLLIPPTWVKDYGSPRLQQVWLEAEKALRRADEVVFIGYSLAATDIQVLFSLCRALHNNVNDPGIVVVNPERRDVVRRRYARLFKGPVRYCEQTFEEWVGRR